MSLPVADQYRSSYESIDSAFVDRADIIQYVDNPPREAIYEILRSSLCEFVLRGIVQEVVSRNCASTP